jgi:hypothetical protein
MPDLAAAGRALRATLGWDPLLFGVLALAIFAIALVLGWQLNGEDDPEPRRVFSGPTVSDDAPRADVAGVIGQITDNIITVRDVDGPIDVTVSDSALLQTLAPIEPSDVQIDDLVIVGGIDENFFSYIVQGVIVLDPAEAAP